MIITRLSAGYAFAYRNLRQEVGYVAALRTKLVMLVKEKVGVDLDNCK